MLALRGGSALVKSRLKGADQLDIQTKVTHYRNMF